MPSTGRYAIYFAPAEDTAIWRFGIGWLGRDPVADKALLQPDVPGLTAAQVATATESPRQYGFHATLKPPFHLADSSTEVDLRAAAAAFSAAHRPFTAPAVSLQRIGRFQAFALTAPSAEMYHLAADCITAFDRFRAPPSASELAKRRERGLTDRQESYLQAWGYPYVMEEFRFHMTMLGSTSDEALHAAITAYLQPLAGHFAEQPLAVDAICLYHQQAHDAPFLLTERFAFTANG